MRKLLRNLALVAVAAVGAVSCTKSDIEDNINVESNKLVLSATTPCGGPSTKIAFEDNAAEGIALSWEDGDSFDLYTEDGYKPIDTFTTTGDGNFISSIADLTLTPGTKYRTEFNYTGGSILNQNGDDIHSLNGACQMEAYFVYGEDEVIEFKHQMAIMTFKFRSESRPAKLVFNIYNHQYDYTTYTVNYETIEPSADGLYSSHIMINPRAAGDKQLTFSLYAKDATEPYDVRVVNSSKAYVAGVRYTSPMSDIEEVSWSGSGTAEDPYKIETAAHLRRLAMEVNSNKSYNQKHFILTQDIDLGGIDGAGNGIEGNEFTPIGGKEGRSFQGIFDGNNCKISGLYVNLPEAEYAGLFGKAAGATIKDLSVSGRVTGQEDVGGIVGYLSCTMISITIDRPSVISSCYSDVIVTGTKNVGGIAGYCSYTTATSCHNAGKVTANGECTGGVFGRLAVTTVPATDCSNQGVVNGGTEYTGGVVGSLRGSGYLSMSYNNAEVNGNRYTGGIVGGSESNAYITSCFNRGNVNGGINGGYYTGGVIGAAINSTTAKMCYNTGEVKVSGTNRMGSVLGKNGENCEIRNCYFKTATCDQGGIGEADANASGIALEMSEIEMKADGFLTTLNNAAYEHNSENADNAKAGQIHAWKAGDDGYPVIDFDNAPSYTEIPTDLQFDEATQTYLIPNADALREFAAKANTEDNAIKGKLVSNIDLENIEFTPIGNATTPFLGSFDGAGYKISGLNINMPDNNEVALFGCVKGATIQDLGVSGSVIGGARVGGIVGKSSYSGDYFDSRKNSTITSCYSEVTVTGKGNETGGVVGYAEYTDISSCYNTGDVTSEGTAYAGGIAGWVKEAPISLCYNEGAIKGAGDHIGGITGHVNKSSIILSYNKGTIGAEGRKRVGGIAGSNYNTSVIAGVYNSGEIFGESLYGGIVGSANDSTSAFKFYTTSCYNIGNIAGDNSGGSVFGTINGNSELKYGYYLSGTCTNGGIYYIYTGSIGLATEKSEEEMKSEDFLVLLNNASFEYNEGHKDAAQLCAWKAGNDGYPVFDYDNKPTYTEPKTDLGYDEATDTYLIGNVDALLEFAAMVKGIDNSANGRLTADIDLKNEPFKPIASYKIPYKGTFDGAGFKISGVNINTPDKDYVGFFGSISGATIKNLGVSGSIVGKISVGGIVGFVADGDSSQNPSSCITACYNEADVTSNGNYAGGIAGQTTYDSRITSCYNTGDVTCKDNYGGGIVGHLNYRNHVINCYNRGTVNVTDESAGGIIGRLISDNILSICYSAGNVISFWGLYTGAILGNIYGSNSVISSTYYDQELYKHSNERGIGSVPDDVVMAKPMATEDMTGETLEVLLNEAVEAYNRENPEAQLYYWKTGDDGYPTLNYHNHD